MPSWFGFPLTVRSDAPFTRDSLIRHVNSKRIGTRLLFGGNIVRQPAYCKDVSFRVAGELANSDVIMSDTFWVGVYPGLTDAMIEYVVHSISELCR